MAQVNRKIFELQITICEQKTLADLGLGRRAREMFRDFSDVVCRSYAMEVSKHRTGVTFSKVLRVISIPLGHFTGFCRVFIEFSKHPVKSHKNPKFCKKKSVKNL